VSSVIFGVRLDELASVEQLRGVATGFLDGDRAFRIFTPNPEILLHAREDTGYANVLRSADLALPDGTGVAVVQTLRNGRSVRRWPGVEIAALLLRLAAERGETGGFRRRHPRCGRTLGRAMARAPRAQGRDRGRRRHHRRGRSRPPRRH
jgi:UDP-N-acetyl-D-mannosaminuronic acid transferase (WecB/TagA/CpsF family)